MSLLHQHIKEVLKIKVEISEEELKKTCNQIQSEEEGRFKNPQFMPKGEGIFLSLETEKDQDLETIEYITLEKDIHGFFVGYWIGLKNQDKLIRTKIFPLFENDAHHVVLAFVKVSKYLTEYIEE